MVTVKFILGLPPFPENPISQEAMDRSKLLAELNAENREHGDLVILPVSLCFRRNESGGWMNGVIGRFLKSIVYIARTMCVTKSRKLRRVIH